MGKKTTKTSSTSEPPSWAKPALEGAGNTILSTVQGNAGNLSGLESGLTGSVLPGLTAKANSGAMLQPGQAYNSQVLAGKFLNSNPANAQLAAQGNGSMLNSNPYTQAMMQQAGQAAGNAVNSTFSEAGRTGSGNHATDLARGVDQAQNQVGFQNYQNERGLQNQALGQLSGNYNTAIGQQTASAGMLPEYQSSQFAGYTPLAQTTQLAGQLPYYGTQALGSIGGLYSGYGTQSGTQPGGWGTNLLNAAASAAGAAAMAGSDRRLKTKIVKIGEAKDGLGIYEWNWKSAPDGDRVTGVLADEVKTLRPHAHVPNFIGEYDGVNYAALGSME